MKKILKRLGIESLNKMQREILSLGTEFKNLVLHSPTGSGKTLAYLLPLLSLLKETEDIQVLIIIPTRELALQVEEVFNKMKTQWKIVCCYGGHGIDTEKEAIKNKKPQILIGTPGRLLDHLFRDNFNPNAIETLIIDEFDKALEFGFQVEMENIITQLMHIKRRILLSATEMAIIPAFTGVENPKILNNITAKLSVNRLRYNLIYSDERDKIKTLYNLLGTFTEGAAIVFCNHRESVERVSLLLDDRNVINVPYHGGQDQLIRERSLAKFKNGSSLVLVSTDLASRGLDISDVQHIIHYHLPLDRETFIHRNGRTARWEEKGDIYMILNEKEEIPTFIIEDFIPYSIKNEKIVHRNPEWVTLYIGRGGKHNISKGDIAGFLYRQGKLKRDELGVIDLQDYCSFVAVCRNKVKEVLDLVKDEKIKGMKTIIEEAK